jgi:hypothetical protein
LQQKHLFPREAGVFAMDALVTDALVTDALVTDALVTDALAQGCRYRQEQPPAR